MSKLCAAMVALMLITVTGEAAAVPQTMTFTARVSVDGAPANGTFDFTTFLPKDSAFLGSLTTRDGLR